MESQSRALSAEAPVPSEVKDLQAELQDRLWALQQQQQDPVNILDDDKVDKVTSQFSFMAFAISLKTFKQTELQEDD